MATLRAEIKRGFLRCLFRSCNPTATLDKVLAAFQDSGFSAIKSGKLLIGSSGAGYTVSFKSPAVGDQFKQEEVFALSEEFIQTYTDCQAALVAAGADSSDQSIFNAMLADDRMQSIRSYMGDNLFARQPFVGTLSA